LGNKVYTERLGRVKLHALVGWFENAIDNADMTSKLQRRLTCLQVMSELKRWMKATAPTVLPEETIVTRSLKPLYRVA
jgi:hypothetical protein